jgi:hypothetical protein
MSRGFDSRSRKPVLTAIAAKSKALPVSEDALNQNLEHAFSPFHTA